MDWGSEHVSFPEWANIFSKNESFENGPAQTRNFMAQLITLW